MERFNVWETINPASFALQVAEHTWGLDVKTFLGDYVNWGNGPFHAMVEQGAWNYRCGLALLSWLQALATVSVLHALTSCRLRLSGLACWGRGSCIAQHWVLRFRTVVLNCCTPGL